MGVVGWLGIIGLIKKEERKVFFSTFLIFSHFSGEPYGFLWQNLMKKKTQLHFL